MFEASKLGTRLTEWNLELPTMQVGIASPAQPQTTLRVALYTHNREKNSRVEP